jgi:hypothetical protein
LALLICGEVAQAKQAVVKGKLRKLYKVKILSKDDGDDGMLPAAIEGEEAPSNQLKAKVSRLRFTQKEAPAAASTPAPSAQATSAPAPAASTPSTPASSTPAPQATSAAPATAAPASNPAADTAAQQASVDAQENKVEAEEKQVEAEKAAVDNEATKVEQTEQQLASTEQQVQQDQAAAEETKGDGEGGCCFPVTVGPKDIPNGDTRSVMVIGDKKANAEKAAQVETPEHLLSDPKELKKVEHDIPKIDEQIQAVSQKVKEIEEAPLVPSDDGTVVAKTPSL